MTEGASLRLALRPATLAYPESHVAGVLLGIAVGLGGGLRLSATGEIPPGLTACVMAIAWACLLLALVLYLSLIHI